MTAPFTAVAIAGAADLAEAERLLQSAGLPRDGLDVCARDGMLLVARADDGCLLGCVALETFGETVLLRSLAVTAGARGNGLGSALVARALGHARAAGAREAWLLTETAGPFFAARGWETADRAAAPAGVAGSVEFMGACPSSASAMRRAL
jgi:N-acetylglutamate synthase-like GNAT family acetyltransferase